MARKFPAKNIIGSRLALARRACKPPLTQDGLSGRLARIGIQLDRAAVAKIEAGLRRVFDYEIKAIARVLGVNVDWLLEGDKK